MTPASARTDGSTAAGHVPPQRSRGEDLRTLQVVPEFLSVCAPDLQIQRSLPLLRVVRFAPIADAATDSEDPHPQADVALASATSGHLAVAGQAAIIPSRRGLWSEASVSFLLSHYPTSKPVREISAELGRSVSAVYGKARRLNLKRPRRGAASGEPVVALPVPAPVPDVPQPKVALAPEQLAPKLPASQPGLPIPQPTPCVSKPPPAPKAERTKLGGRQGCWTENDGALSERLERLFIANFSPSCIAAVLGVTVSAVETRAWVVNCPRRDPQALRHDIEAARLVDRLAAPLPRSVYSWKTGKMLVRKRCSRKGHHIWGASGTTLSNDAKRQRSYKILMASVPMHAW